LEQLLQKNFEEVGVLSHTEEELAFADALAKTYPGSDAVPGTGSACEDDYAGKAAELQKECGHAMNDFLLPLFNGNSFTPGSTDVGDVSWQTPVGQVHVAAWPNGCPGHSWQNISCAGTGLGYKSAVHAGKVLSCAVIDLMTDGETLAKARAEFEKATKAGYTCPIPADAVPVVPD
jgi:aminobenzoyl-glutamate utilization protein B